MNKYLCAVYANLLQVVELGALTKLHGMHFAKKITYGSCGDGKRQIQF